MQETGIFSAFNLFDTFGFRSGFRVRLAHFVSGGLGGRHVSRETPLDPAKLAKL